MLGKLLSGGLEGIIGGVGKVVDDLHTSDEERLKAQYDLEKLDHEKTMGQIEINKVEAQHKSVFVAGWRPAVGWVGALALMYQFIAYPLLTWGWALLQANDVVPLDLSPPPILDTDALWVLLSGMLGIAGMRSFDKTKKTQTDRM